MKHPALRWIVAYVSAMCVLGRLIVPAWAGEEGVAPPAGAPVLTQFMSTATPSTPAKECPEGTFKPLFRAGCAKMSAETKLPTQDDEPMRFEALQLSKAVSILQGIGRITKETPAEFARFMAGDAAKSSKELALHSTGGDVAAGMELGRAIRTAQLNTSIGRTIPLEGVLKVHRFKDSACTAACAYAFLGGVSRAFATGAIFGPETPPPPPPASLQYVSEMGVDSRVLGADAGAVSEARAKEWHVIHDGSGMTTFRIEQSSGKSVARFDFTARDHKFAGTLACVEGHPVMALQDLDAAIHPTLRVMNQNATEFDANGRKVPATATYVAKTDLLPAQAIFVLQSLDEKSFSGAGLSLTSIAPPQSPPMPGNGVLDALSWGDAESAFLFRIVADNGERTLGAVLRDCR